MLTPIRHRSLVSLVLLLASGSSLAATPLPSERASAERTTTEIRLSMEAGSPHYQTWPGGGTTIHNGTGYIEPLGRAEYSCGLNYPEQPRFPLPSYINADWMRSHSVEGLLFCAYTLADGVIYAYDSIAGHLQRDAGNRERRDVLINLIVGGSGAYAGATGTWIGRAQGRGAAKEVAPGRTLPLSILKLMEGYINVPVATQPASATAPDPRLNADGKYTMQLRTGEEGRKVGERWQGTNRGGQPESFQLIQGRR